MRKMTKEIEKAIKIEEGQNKMEQQEMSKPKELLENYLMSEFDLGVNQLERYQNNLFAIIPELRAEEGFEHMHPHHAYDVWKHTLIALEKSKPDLQIRLALLLHDIGKPYCYQQDGHIRHFRGHPKKSAEMTETILTRLGYATKEIEEIGYLVENHDTIININKVNQDNRDLIEKQLHMQYCDAYAHHPAHIEKRIKKLDEIKERMEEKIKEQEKMQELVKEETKQEGR